MNRTDVMAAICQGSRQGDVSIELPANSARAVLSVPVLPGSETEASLFAFTAHAANVESEARKLKSASSSVDEL